MTFYPQAHKIGISVATLKSLVSVDPSTGFLTWNPREASACGGKRAAHTAAAWNARFAGKRAFITPHEGGLLRGRMARHNILAHHAAWALYYGEWPSSPILHKNDDGTDNRKENLVQTEIPESISWTHTIPANNTSGVKGVSWHKARGHWQARIYVQGQAIALGSFASLADATSARRTAELQYFGLEQNETKT